MKACRKPIKHQKVLWTSRKKNNGLGHKYRLILDKCGWVRAYIKVDGKGKWLELEAVVHGELGAMAIGVLGGFEEAVGRELLKVGDLK
jgi:hypothetical protein